MRLLRTTFQGVCLSLFLFEALGAQTRETALPASLKKIYESAMDGNANSQYLLGIVFSKGLLAEIPIDFKAAIHWFTLASSQEVRNTSSSAAAFELAKIFRDGTGVPKDQSESAKWALLGATHGNAASQTLIASYYFSGTGVAKDYGAAANFARLAADQGQPHGQALLGGLYEYGNGVPKDLVLAYMWYNLAATSLKGEHREAISKYRDDLEKRLTTAQVEAAQRMSREWKPKTQIEH